MSRRKGNSPYSNVSKPSFFSQMRNRTFNETKKNDQSSTVTKTSSGIGNMEPSSHGPSPGLGNMTPSDTSKSPSSGLGNLEPSPHSSKSSSSGLGNMEPTSRKSQSPNPELGTPEPSSNVAGSTSPYVGLGNLAQLQLIPDTETTPSPETSPPHIPLVQSRQEKISPVAKPRTKLVPKPRPRSFNGEDSLKVININTPPVPAPRKNKPVKPVSTRETAYSKGTKEYKAQKKETINKKSETQPKTPLGPPKGPALLFPPSSLNNALEDEHSLINILDLELLSIKSQYLKPEDYDDEPDSDEDTNQQIGLLEQLGHKDTTGSGNDDDDITITPITTATQKSASNTTMRASKSPPPKPKRSRSPLFKQKEFTTSETVDPTAALSRSQTYNDFPEEKEKKKKWSPFAKRKNKKPEQTWELPKESVAREPDSESIMSESTTISPAEFPLHKTKQVGDLQQIIAKNPLIDVNKRDINYNTPIHYMLKRKRSTKRCGLMMTLLQTGRVDVNALDCDDNTPLHLAAKLDDYRCAAVLLAFNADPFILNKEFLQPIHLTRPMTTIHTLLSKQFKPLLNSDPVTLSSLPEATTHVDPQDFINETIGRLLMPDKINCFVRKIDSVVKSFEQDSLHDSYEAQPMSLRELTDYEKDIRESLNDQKFYLKRWKKTSGSRVLFLDGGGIRGLIQIEILMELEKRTGRRITELFDWIIGTSTGGLVALGLVYGGKTLGQMRQLYFKIKNEVFGGNIAGTFMKMPQKSKKFDQILKNLFGEDMLMSNQTHPRVMICTVNKANLPLRVIFFNNFMQDNTELTEFPVWKAARASSAAPMYFTEVDGKYVDGGVLANNPCEFAMTQINQYDDKMGLPARHFAMAVSIGTGTFPNRNFGDSSGKDFGFFNLKKQVKYVKDLTEMFVEAVADSEMTAEKFAVWCQQWKDPIPCFRLNPSLENVVSPGETDDDKLIDMLLDTKLYLAKEGTLQTFANIVKVFKRLQSDK